MSELNHKCVETIINTDLQTCTSANSVQIAGTASHALSATTMEQQRHTVDNPSAWNLQDKTGGFSFKT